MCNEYCSSIKELIVQYPLFDEHEYKIEWVKQMFKKIYVDYVILY